METRLYKGQWWLPGSGSEYVYGNLFLELESNNYKLSILGKFDKSSKKDWSNYDLIIGIGKNEETGIDFSFRLLKVHQTKFQTGAALNSSEFVIDEILFCKGLYTEPQLSFSYFQFRTNYLKDWLDLKGYAMNIGDSLLDLDIRRIKVKPVELFHGKGMTITGGIETSIQYRLDNPVTLKDNGFIEVELDKDLTITEIKDLAQVIKNFLHLAIGRHIFFEEFKVGIKRSENIFDMIGSEINIQKKSDGVYKAAMPLNFSEIKDNPATYFNQWFCLQDAIKLTLRNYFVNYKQPYFQEDEFLNLVTALEVYHRSRYDNSNARSEKFIEKRNRILEKVTDKNDRGWLEKQLRIKKDSRLKTKIKELLEFFSDKIDGLLTNPEIFAAQVVATRNYLVHEVINDEDKIVHTAKGKEVLTERLRVILEAILLYEVGCKEEKINGKVRNNPRNHRIFKSQKYGFNL